MSTIPRPYDSLRTYFNQHLADSPAQHHNLALWVFGLFKARSCHLGRVADELPLEGQRDSLIQRLKRWLMHPIDPQELYLSLVRPWLERWPANQELVLILDRFSVADRFNVLLLAVAFRGRAIPLTWKLLPHQGSSSFAYQKQLLEQVRLLPAKVPVALMGDGEFRSIELFEYAHQHQWDFALGHKGDLRIFREDLDCWQSLKSLSAQPGKPLYLSPVWLSLQESFGPVNLMAFWDEEDRCVRYRFTNRPANGHTLRWSRKRSWIEGLIRDFKSGGFQLDHTRLQHTPRLNRLLLVMATATLWFVAIASRLVKQGQRPQLDNNTKRTHTYFQLGWSWLKRKARLLLPIPFDLLVYF